MVPTSTTLATATTVAAGNVMVHTFAKDNPITSVFSKAQSDVLQPILTGILIVIATIAVIVLVKDVIAAATSDQGMEQKNHIKAAVIVLVACLLLGFLPQLINWFISIGGSANGYATASFGK